MSWARRQPTLAVGPSHEIRHMAGALEARGFAVLLTQDVREAHSILARGLYPALVLLDCRLEGTGWGLLTELDQKHLEDVPVVILSDEEEPGEDFLSGVVCLRPEDVDGLLTVARQYAVAAN